MIVFIACCRRKSLAFSGKKSLQEIYKGNCNTNFIRGCHRIEEPAERADDKW